MNIICKVKQGGLLSVSMLSLTKHSIWNVLSAYDKWYTISGRGSKITEFRKYTAELYYMGVQYNKHPMHE